ncbi:MAG TPA: VCBS repeat-containing protein, partial [Polyangiaceae bacterium]|nr:VCBS repeat-containing protein [Polyangiaceae bacterium]
ASLAPLADLVATKKLAGAVLSVLDLDDDGLLDVIGSHGVFLQKADGTFFRAASPLAGSAWSQAVTGDFNGDGRLDVVAAPDGGLDLDLALGSASSYLNPIVLPTDGFAGLLVAGDFDGDGVTDLALRERDPETPTEVVDGMAVPVCSALDDLVIRFGSQTGPGDRTIVARAAGIEQIYPGRLPRLDKRDSIEDFGAVLHCAADGEAENRVSVFYGALSRQVAAPFLLNDQLDDPSQPLSPPFIIPFQPRATTATSVGGKHIAAAVGTSIAAFRPPSVPTGYPEPSEVGLFVLESGDAGPFSGAHLVPMLQKLPGVDTLADTAFHIGMGDLDGDGATDGQQEVVVTIDRTLYIARNWSNYAGDSDQDSIANAKEDVDAFELPGAAAALLVADLDGDGNADIAVAGGTSDEPFLVVMFGGDPNQQVSIDTGGVGVTALAALPVYSMAADAPPTPERLSLLVSSDAAPVQSVSISADRSVGALTTLQQKKFPHVNGLLVTDVDGDRFEDVVVLTPTSTSVIQREPTLAGDEQGGAE